MIHLFFEGGIVVMSLLTIVLLALIVSIWKAPRVVRSFGLLAWGIAFMFQIPNLLMELDGIQCQGGVEQPVFVGTIKLWLIPFAYASLIYVVSVLVDIVIKLKKH